MFNKKLEKRIDELESRLGNLIGIVKDQSDNTVLDEKIDTLTKHLGVEIKPGWVEEKSVTKKVAWVLTKIKNGKKKTKNK